MAQIIDGKAVAAKIRQIAAKEAAELATPPRLAVVLVGDDEASKVYVRQKERACQQVGIVSKMINLPATTTQQQLLDVVEQLNSDASVSGILVQLPLPQHIDEHTVVCAIDPAKDVDCFHPQNVGKMMIGLPYFLPCTPAGVLELLRQYQVPVKGADCVVIGRSNIVGKPLGVMLCNMGATVTICHSNTKNLAQKCAAADIIVSCVGKINFIDPTMVKEGAVVIDVGTNRGADGKLHGDVQFEAVAPKCSAITPVPGGVGPMTVAMLMQNTVKAAKNQQKQVDNI